MSVPLVRGRAFGTQDTAASSRVVIVNQTLAKKLFDTADAAGRHVRLGREEPVDAEVVGVTRDGKYADLNEAPQPYLYLPLSQKDRSEVTLIVTTAGDARELLPVVRKALQQTSPNTVIINTQTLTDHMRFVTYANRMAAWLTASLGGLALLLTTLGLYGVTAYSVARRTREIGIRMAFGALRKTVFIRVLKDGLTLTVAGMVLGVCLAALLGRGMSSLLYGVKPSDPIVLSVAVVLILSTSFTALIIPARRALRIDPVEAIREE
jgi:ABC-type antimicrobial peptide transport system permease subunit